MSPRNPLFWKYHAAIWVDGQGFAPAVDTSAILNLFRYLKSLIIICNFDRLEIVKSKVEQPAGILILRVVAVQDDGNQCRIALSGTIDQCVEGDGGITGFAAEDVRTVVLRPVL